MNSSIKPEIVKVTPFDPKGEGSAIAAVTVRLGPVTIYGKLRQTGERLFLGMPGHYNENQSKWYDTVKIVDWDLHQEATAMAVEAYQRVSQSVAA